jgi:hypothetical protein
MRILCNILVVLFVTATAVGQQINPVPDYIFRNSMSVGRNAPTDTSAYFSIGPRFGATRGFMPPMVVDTAAVTGTKRNGLLIYSIQRNSFLYWDSTGSRWSRIAANLDTLLLSTRAWRQKGDDSLAAIINTRTDTVNLLSTKAWRQKGIDSINAVNASGTGISGYITRWSGTKTMDTSQIFQQANRIGIGNTSPAYILDITGTLRNTGNAFFNTTPGESYFGTTTDAGDFRVQVSGNFYNTGSALLAATSGNVGIGAANKTWSLGKAVEISGGMSLLGYIDQSYYVNNAYFNATWRYKNTGTAAMYLQTAQATHTWSTAATGAADASFNWTERMRLDSLGNFGIGTTSPSEALHVVGRARVTTIDSSASPINMLWADVNGVVRKAPVPTASVSGGTTDFIPLWSSSTALTSSVIKQVSSEILIGYTTDQGTFKLQVDGNTFTNGSIKTAAPSGGTAAEWKLGIVVAGSYTAASNYLQVDVGGTLYYIGLVTPN